MKLEAQNIPATFAIVDDHRAVADIMGYALQTRIKATCVGKYYTVEDARQRLEAIKPTVVITDWRIQNETSAKLVSEVSTKIPKTKWLLFTAWATSSVLKEAISSGIHGCVSKSADYEELSRAMEKLIRGETYFCEASLQCIGRELSKKNSGISLNHTEKAILRCIAEGLGPKEIASRIHLTPKTIHNSITLIRQKVNLGSMVELSNFAISEGIAPPR